MSVIILLLIIGLQCFNFIIIRFLLLKYSSNILSFVKFNSYIYKVFQHIFNILEKTYKFYIIGFTFLGYINIIGAIIFSFYLLDFLSSTQNLNPALKKSTRF